MEIHDIDKDENVDISLNDGNKNTKLVDPARIISNTVGEIVKCFTRITPAIDNARSMMGAISRFFEKIDYSAIIEKINQFREYLYRQIMSLQLPQYSEERKKSLIQSYEMWGQYGWTMNPLASPVLFNSCPNTLKDANALARHYCSIMNPIFDEIRSCKRVKKDFEEAVFSFENKKYKSCALVLFTLIESSLIRTQKHTRAVGKGAINKAEDRKNDIHIESFFQMLILNNYFACLKKMFEGAPNFKPQPDVINRNFLCHGMLWRDVRRGDCIKLFLVYYNTLLYLELLYS